MPIGTELKVAEPVTIVNLRLQLQRQQIHLEQAEDQLIQKQDDPEHNIHVRSTHNYVHYGIGIVTFEGAIHTLMARIAEEEDNQQLSALHRHQVDQIKQIIEAGINSDYRPLGARLKQRGQGCLQAGAAGAKSGSYWATLGVVYLEMGEVLFDMADN